MKYSVKHPLRWCGADRQIQLRKCHVRHKHLPCGGRVLCAAQEHRRNVKEMSGRAGYETLEVWVGGPSFHKYLPVNYQLYIL